MPREPATRSATSVAVLSPNLSLGGTLACVTIVQALKDTYRVRLVGCQFGETAWPGLADADIDVTSYPGRPMPGFIALANRIVKDTDADIVIAHQHRMSSFGIALLHRFRKRSRCLLYIDDDDLALTMPGRSMPLRSRLTSVTGDLSTRLMYRLRGKADTVLCGSDYFSARYGGSTVPLGRDAERFDPARFDAAAIRADLGIAEDEFVIGFVGNPRPHTGIEDLVEAIAGSGERRYTLMVVPAGSNSNFAQSLFAGTSARIRVYENQPSRRVPEYLAAADIAVLPQRSETISFGQLPARLIDAMAMAKPIVSTPISDIPNVLDGCGMLIDERRPDEIARAIAWLDQNRDAAREMGLRARQQFLSRLSLESMRDALVEHIERLK